MTPFQPVQKLAVYRRLVNGKEVRVGELAQNKRAVYFQYNSDYLANYHSLSPFKLDFSSGLTEAPATPHHGLHGVFADSLPDGWGLLLMDRVFRQQNISPQQITTMDRLAYIGDTGIGALSYRPITDWKTRDNSWIELATLGKHATQLFDGEADTVLAALANAGGSGGARPKALIYIDAQQNHKISTYPQAGLQTWLIKFTSQHLLLKHDEGLCEAAYLTMAKSAGIDVPEWKLFTPPSSSGAKAWLAMKRFDCSYNNNDTGRYHTHSLCGLLDADFRQPSMDYEDLIKASQILCNSPAVGQQQFTRAIFNLFASNQDDHTKNWSFLMDDKGQWQPSPGYDITFSPAPSNQHMTTFAGYGSQPPKKAIQKLAQQANIPYWKDTQRIISQVLDALAQWNKVAKETGISKDITRLIAKQLDTVYQENKGLLDA